MATSVKSRREASEHQAGTLEEIERRLRIELESLAYRVFTPVELADLVEFVKDALASAFNTSTDNVRVETGLVIEEKHPHHSVFNEKLEIIEARGLFCIRADVFADRTYYVYAECKAHFITVPERTAHIVVEIDPPRELRVSV